MDGMLVQRRVTPSIEFASTHLYTRVERGTVRVKCLAQEHNSVHGEDNVLLLITGLGVATCGVANATGFGLLATNFSRVVASLATAISSYYFIFIYFFIS